MHLGRESTQLAHAEGLSWHSTTLEGTDGALRVPTSEQFALIRSQARSAGKLKDLRQLATAWEEVAKRCDLAFEELFRLAVFRLEVERDLGAYLAQTVQRGGDRSKYPRATLLPDGISKKQSSMYQKLATISEDEFRAYIGHSREARRTPSSRGARAFAGANGSKVRRAPRTKRAHDEVILSSALLEACVRCLGDIDVLIGKAKAKAAACFTDFAGLPKTARGSMFVVGSSDPAEILRRVAGLRETGRIEEAIVALPRDIDAGWWTSLKSGSWSLCVPNEPGGAIVAHIGGRAHAFALVFAPLGVVAEVKPRLGDHAHAHA